MFIVLITKSYDKSVWCNFSVHCLIFYNFLFYSSVCKCIDSVLSYMYNHDTGIYIQVTFITDM